MAWWMHAALALANGQTSHQWITEAAVDALPAGPLRELVTREDLRDALLNGTMFPDGGYAIDHPYGEIAHWEPFQDAYLRWIAARCEAPYDDACARHVAFLLGLRSHGLADQHYDAVYMETSRAVDVDGWVSGLSFDEATDVAFAAAAGPGEVPSPWLPMEPLISLFGDAGVAVSEADVSRGQDRLGLAIAAVGGLATVEPALARYQAAFPWGCAHQLDPEASGNPPHEAELVAAYWQVTWDRLRDESAVPQGVLAVVPDGWPRAGALVRSRTDPRSRLQVVFRRGLDPATVEASRFELRGDLGDIMPVTPNVFYGRSSHVVNLTPATDWRPGATYTLTVAPGIASFDGLVSEETERFLVETGPPAPPASRGCAISHVAGSWTWILAIGGAALSAPRWRRRDCRSSTRRPPRTTPATNPR